MKLSNFTLLGLGSGALAANCTLSQRRQAPEPNGTQIANCLTSYSRLDNVCDDNWRLQDVDRLDKTYNTGSECPSPFVESIVLTLTL